MYDYMKALEDRFTPEARNAERRQEFETYHQAVSVLLDSREGKSCSDWWMPTPQCRRKWH